MNENRSKAKNGEPTFLMCEGKNSKRISHEG